MSSITLMKCIYVEGGVYFTVLFQTKIRFIKSTLRYRVRDRIVCTGRRCSKSVLFTYVSRSREREKKKGLKFERWKSRIGERRRRSGGRLRICIKLISRPIRRPVSTGRWEQHEGKFSTVFNSARKYVFEPWSSRSVAFLFSPTSAKSDFAISVAFSVGFSFMLV